MIQKQKSKQTISTQKIEKKKDSNEIDIRRRTLDNNTHEVIEDTKIKRVTSWRKSQAKFFKSMVYNILSFGILHLYFIQIYLLNYIVILHQEQNVIISL